MVRTSCLVKDLAATDLITSYGQIHSIWCVGPCLAFVAEYSCRLFQMFQNFARKFLFPLQ